MNQSIQMNLDMAMQLGGVKPAEIKPSSGSSDFSATLNEVSSGAPDRPAQRGPSGNNGNDASSDGGKKRSEDGKDLPSRRDRHAQDARSDDGGVDQDKADTRQATSASSEKPNLEKSPHLVDEGDACLLYTSPSPRDS